MFVMFAMSVLCLCVWPGVFRVNLCVRLSVLYSGVYVVFLPPPSRCVFLSSGVSSVLFNYTFARFVSFLFLLSLSLLVVSRVGRQSLSCGFAWRFGASFVVFFFSLSCSLPSRAPGGVGVDLRVRCHAGCIVRLVWLSLVSSALLSYRLGVFARDGSRRPLVCRPPSGAGHVHIFSVAHA